MNRLLIALFGSMFFALAACESTPTYTPEPEPEPEVYTEPDPEPTPEPEPTEPRFDRTKPPERPWKAIEREKLYLPNYKRKTFGEFMEGPVASWRKKLRPEFFEGSPHAMKNVQTSGSWWNGIATLKVESKTESDGGWKAHGYGEAVYNSNGAIFAKAYFRDGQLHGPFIMYREDGSIQKITCYTMGYEDGPYAGFTEGVLTTRGAYLNTGGTTEWETWDVEGNLTNRTKYNVTWKFEYGKQSTTYERVWMRNYNKLGELTYLRIYKDDKLDGSCIDWVDPVLDAEGNVTNAAKVGRLEIESYDEDGKQHGWLTIYHPKDSYRLYDTWYEKGEQTGPFFEYTPEGKVRSKGQKIKGNNRGRWTIYDSNGAIRAFTFDDDGKLHGDYVIRDKDGNVTTRLQYNHGDMEAAGLSSCKAAEIDKDFVVDRDELWLGQGKTTADGKFDADWVFKRADGTLAATGSYKEGRRSGAWKFFQADGTTLRTDCNLLNDLLDGACANYYADGTKSAEGSYTRGKRTGDWTYWYANGQVSQTGGFVVGMFASYAERSGEWRYYFENGQLRTKGTYTYGKSTGSWLVYDEAGALVGIDTYKDTGELDTAASLEAALENVPVGVTLDPEKITGTWVWKDVLGTLRRRAVVINGEGAGLFQEYYPNGKLGMEGTLSGESREGLWKIWTDTGVLKEQAEYAGGKKNGTYTSFRAVGTRATEGNFADDIKSGSWKTFHTDGETVLTEYTHGPTGEYEGAYRTWTATGQQTVEGSYTANKKHGPWKEWYPDGTQKIDTTYDSGEVTGQHRTWHNNGTLERDGIYKSNKPHGEMKAWYNDGQMQFHEIYDDAGVKQGTWLYWYSNGQQNMEHTYKDGVQLSYKRWYDDGKQWHEKYYDETGNPTGIWKEWDKDGTLKSEVDHNKQDEGK